MILGLLGILFVAFKLLGVISWPWLYVLAPFWIPMAVFVCLFMIAALASVVGAVMECR